jgi:hypothetical protein
MHPRRRLPPRRELSAQERALFAEAMARRERIVPQEERAAFLASLERVLASATSKQLEWARKGSFYHLGTTFKPSE